MGEQKILRIEDHLEIAKGLHSTSGGRVGLWPFFRLVRWTDERMGLDSGYRAKEIASLISRARGERRLDGRHTADALSFSALAERLPDLLPLAVEAVRKARES